MGRDDLHDNGAAHTFGGIPCVFAAHYDLVIGNGEVLLPENVIIFCFTQHLLGQKFTSNSGCTIFLVFSGMGILWNYCALEGSFLNKDHARILIF